MALYKIRKGTPGVLVAPSGERKDFVTRRNLEFPEAATNGPFEGLYIFERDEFVLYVSPDFVEISKADRVLSTENN